MKRIRRIVDQDCLQYKKILRQRLELLYATVNTNIAEAYPDFICIGAPRSGTTWLYSILKRHPDYFVSRRKEMHFFDEPIIIEKNGSTQNINACFYNMYFNMKKSSHWRWYYLQYAGHTGKTKGDITPAYSRLSEERVKYIADSIKDLKIIYMIRNPIERAWSGVRYFSCSKNMQNISDMSIDEINEFTMRPRRLMGGEYKSIISKWERYFDPSKILYLFYDDLAHDPYNLAESVYSFLGMDPDKVSNNNGFSNRINAADNMSTIPPVFYDKWKEYYCGDISFLENKFNKDLSHWLNNSS